MELTAIQIANVLGGEVKGSPAVEVYKLSKIEEGTEESISFLANPKYRHFIYTIHASVVIVGKNFEPESTFTATLVRVGDSYAAFSRLLALYNEIKLNKTGIEQPSFIATIAKVGENVYIGAFAYMGENVVLGNSVKIYPSTYIGGNSVIGDNTIIFSGCKTYSKTVIGKNCTLHSGVVLGIDGFGFAPNEIRIYSKVPQIDNVVLEDNVDIGANSIVDRATLGSTIIRQGVELDNQIQIAHNVGIGKNTVMTAQTGVAGFTKIGENGTIGGQVGIVGHLTIGNRVRIQAQTGVGRDLKDDEAIQGSPALGYAEYNKAYVVSCKLPNLLERIEELEKKLK